MEKDNETNWEAIVKKTVKDIGLESPSPDFTQKVLSKIEDRKQLAARHTPLISRNIWGISAFLLILFFSWIIFGDNTTVPDGIPVDMETPFNDWIMEKLPALNVSNTVLYSIAALAFFISLQVILLRNQINRRFAVH